MNLLDVNILRLPLNKQLLIKRLLSEDSQTFVAEKLNTSQNTISLFESGKAGIPDKSYAELIRYLYSDKVGESDAK